jgi:hypothetical protein
MSTRFATTQHARSSREPAANRVAGIQSAVRQDAARNDDTRASIFNDPLWGMAIATGILFAVLAALIAIG